MLILIAVSFSVAHVPVAVRVTLNVVVGVPVVDEVVDVETTEVDFEVVPADEDTAVEAAGDGVAPVVTPGVVGVVVGV